MEKLYSLSPNFKIKPVKFKQSEQVLVHFLLSD